MKTIYTLRMFLICFLSVLTGIVYGKNEIYRDSTKDLRENKTLTVNDFSSSSSTVKEKSRLILKIGTLPTKPFSGDYKATLKANAKFSDGTTKEITLEVSYSAASLANYKEVATYTYDNSSSMEITIISFEETSSLAQQFNPQLTAQIDVERYYPFSSDKVPTISTHKYLNLTNELLVEWNEIKEAEEYDLEWAWIDNLDINGNSIDKGNIVLKEDIFKNNASRVSLRKNKYLIPVLYERGIIIFRVRAVGTHDGKPNLYKYGNWSYSPNRGTSLASCQSCQEITKGHGERFNWQYSSQYSEDGKRKSSITYYDGSQRNRQAQTKLTTSNETVLTETIYDAQGRPAIQVLPAPTSQAGLSYQTAMTLNQNGKSYSIADFDVDNGAKCSTAAGAMLKTTGSAKYYSEKNDSVAYKHHKQIPNAKGYPFTQVEYTPDNTGRIRKQGGVGADFQIDGKHATTFMYETPTQQELDRLFGAEAGNAEHYKKNTTIDANGQATITYVDMQGKTIATALSGSAPEGMNNLPSRTQTKKQTDVLINDNTNQSVDGITKTYSKEITITESDAPKFTYALTPAQYMAKCSIDETYTKCYNCVVDVSFMVTDECGENYFFSSTGKQYSKTVGDEIINDLKNNTYQNPTVDSKPTKQIIINNQSSSVLRPGSYTVSKILKVNEEALDLYLQRYLNDASNCIVPFATFLKIEDRAENHYDCNISCDDCKKSHEPEKETFINKCMNEGGSYSECLLSFKKYTESVCAKYCNTKITNCEQALTLMLADVSPNGQYGGYDLNEDGTITVSSSKYPLSVYGESQLPKSLANNFNLAGWQMPYHYIKDAGKEVTEGAYYNSDGKKSLIDIYWDSEEKKSYPQVKTDLGDKNTGYYQVPPTDLVNLADFLAVWPADGSWAQSLVYLHPEFEYYNMCLDFEPSHTFDADLISTTLREFIKFYPNFINDPMSYDPLFKTISLKDEYAEFAPNGTYYNLFKKALDAYTSSADGSQISIWKSAYLNVKCPTFTPTPPCNNACLDEVAGTVDFQSKFLEDLSSGDALWNNFRMMYYSLKQKLIEQVMTRRSIPLHAYNGCIGNKAFNPAQDGFNTYNLTSTSEPKGYFHYEVNPIVGLFKSTFDLWRQSNSKAIFVYGGNKIYTPWYFYHQYITNESFNYAQACNVRTAPLYAEKTARYARTADLTSNSVSKADVCYESPDLSASAPGTPPANLKIVDCPAKLTLITESLVRQSRAGTIDECGQCPIAQSLANLFRDVLLKIRNNGNNLLTSVGQDVRLSCYPYGLASYNKDIQDAINFDKTSDIHYWRIEAANNNTLEATIRNGTGTNNICHIILKKLDKYPIKTGNTTSDVSFSWADIKEFCCIEYIDEGVTPLILDQNEFSANKNRRFRIGAWVTYNNKTERIELEGYTDRIIMNSCDFTVCNNNALCADIGTFINTLCAPIPSSTGGMVKLFTNSEVVISSSVNKHLYEAISSNIQNCGVFTGTGEATWKYTSSIKGTIMEIKLTKTSGGTGELLLRLMLQSGLSESDFSNIQDIIYYSENESVIIPNENSSTTVPNPSNNAIFLALGAYGNNTDPQRVKLYLEVPKIKILDCTSYGYKKGKKSK